MTMARAIKLPGRGWRWMGLWTKLTRHSARGSWFVLNEAYPHPHHHQHYPMHCLHCKNSYSCLSVKQLFHFLYWGQHRWLLNGEVTFEATNWIKISFQVIILKSECLITWLRNHLINWMDEYAKDSPYMIYIILAWQSPFVHMMTYHSW